MSGTERPRRPDADSENLARLAVWLAREAPPRARPELLASTLARTRTIRGPGTRRGPLGWSLPRGALSLRFAIVGLLVVALSSAAIVGGRLVLPRTSSPTVPPTVAPSPGPSSAAYPSPLAIVSASRIDPAGGATIGDVTLGGPGLLAVGSVDGAGGTKDAVAWTSRDGVTWTLASTGSAALQNGVMRRVAGRGTALVAVGVDCPAKVRICGSGRAWTSTDGIHWTRAATQFGGPSAGGVGYGFSSIVQGGPGYVMVGGAASADTYGGTYLGAAVATSRDGSRWTIRRLTGAGFDGASFAGVAAGSAGPYAAGGVLVAVGSTAAHTPAIWSSVDGTSWRTVTTSGPFSFPGGSRLEDVAAGPGGYVAVGRGDGPLAGAWVSADGVTWSPAHGTPSFQDAEMTRVEWTGTAFVATGRTAAGDGAAWVSTGGFDWIPVDTGTAFRSAPIVAAAEIDGRIVLFGQDPAGTIVTGTIAAG